MICKDSANAFAVLVCKIGGTDGMARVDE
eukprot:SAG11_NODE_2529_length_3251_cov_2.339467_1_plen_28_part_10